MAFARSRAVSLFFCIAAGLCTAAAWLDFSLYPLAWVAFAPFMLAIWRARSDRGALLVGFATGLVGLVPAFWWLVYTMQVFGGFPWLVALFFYLCLSVFSAGEFALFALAARRLGPGPLGIAAPVVWVAIEFLYPNLFPWRMGHSQLEWTTMLQIGDLTGPYGMSFVLVWCGAGLAQVIHRRRWLPLAAAVAAALAVYSYGAWRWDQITAVTAASPRLRVGLVQGNVGIVEKSDAAYFEINVEKYRALSRRLQDDVDVLIWPETVSHGWIAQSTTRLAPGEDPFPDLATYLIFGGLGYHYERAEVPLRYNTAFLIDGDAAVIARYNKQVLLPFGEYLPFSSWIPFLEEISPNSGNFTPGVKSMTLNLPGGARFAPLICYEDVPAGIAREMTQLGANVLFTIFNDAWFGVSMAPYQHEAIALWRAVENRRFFVRVGNAGDTGVIDAHGRIVERLGLFTAGTLTADVALLDIETFYTRHGDVFAWGVLVVALSWLGIALRRAA